MPCVLLIVDHGSRLEGAHAQLLELAQSVQARLPHFQVRVAHLEMVEPSLDQAVAACVAEGVTELVLYPHFLAPGRHLSQDIPEQVEALTQRYPGLTIRTTPALGDLPGLVDLIVGAL